MLPSLMGRSDDFAPRPMMNWSLSIRYFWLSKTRYSGGAGTPGAPSEKLAYDADGGGGAAVPAWNIPPRPPFGGGIARPKRVAAGSGGGGGGRGPAGAGGRVVWRPWAVCAGGGGGGPAESSGRPPFPPAAVPVLS